MYESPLVDESFGSLTGVVTGYLTCGSWSFMPPTTETACETVIDGCLVPTPPLAQIVRGFVSTWNRERPQTAGQFHAEDDDPISPMRPVAWLAENSRVPEATISRIMHPRGPRTTGLSIADALVNALEQPWLFYDGEPPTLPIMPNPAAPLEARQACCGGSENHGSLNGSASW